MINYYSLQESWVLTHIFIFSSINNTNPSLHYILNPVLPKSFALPSLMGFRDFNASLYYRTIVICFKWIKYFPSINITPNLWININLFVPPLMESSKKECHHKKKKNPYIWVFIMLDNFLHSWTFIFQGLQRPNYNQTILNRSYFF